MSERDTHRLGYRRVDGDEDLPVLLDTMDATASWSATISLRAWERDHLALASGERLLDVGCGLGDVAVSLAEDLGARGEVVGVDTSAEMLRVATERAVAAPCATRFTVGDALALDEPDGSFDAVRAERTLQWVPDPQAAVVEMARVLRPGGRLSLIDTDWSTLRLDVGDPAVASAVARGLRDERGRPSNVGGRLGDLVRVAGLDPGAATSAVQTWTHWDPDVSPAPDGCFSMRSLAEDLVERGELEQGGAEAFLAAVTAAARAGRFTMSLTMAAIVAR